MTDYSDSYISLDWPAPANIGALITTRIGGMSRRPYDHFNLALHVGDAEPDVLDNRTRLTRDQQLASVHWLNQVHGIDVIEIEAGLSSETVPTADASYTRTAGSVCTVLVADCMPVMITNREGTCVGVAHAGWRGLCDGVIADLLSAMQIEPEQAMIWLGSCIGPEIFAVGSEVLAAFKLSAAFQSIDVTSAFKRGDGDTYTADLAQLAKMQLVKMGVQGIYGHRECTYDNPQKYFSYRRDGATGRMAALIWIKG